MISQRGIINIFFEWKYTLDTYRVKNISLHLIKILATGNCRYILMTMKKLHSLRKKNFGISRSYHLAFYVPEIFERLMETELKVHSYEVCLVYIDDIIIVGCAFQEHLSNIQKVLGNIKMAKFKPCRLLNPSPSIISFVVELPRHISAEGVRMDPEKISAVVTGLIL